MPTTDIVGRDANPLDMIENIATSNDWSFDRATEDEITISITGSLTDYQVSITWMDEIEALHIACAFDMKVPDARRAEVQRLISAVNQHMWVGHFDLWTDESIVLYRHALLLAGGAEASDQQCEALVQIAVDACERHYQAFQFVVWAGKTAKEALEAVLFETMGEA